MKFVNSGSKIPFFAIFFFVFSLVIMYCVCEKFYLKDDFFYFYSLSSGIYPEGDDVDGGSFFMELRVDSYECGEKECILNYCILNDCKYEIRLPSDRFRGQKYQGAGNYIVNLNFENYKFSLSHKRFLKDWTLEIVEGKEPERENFLLGIKDLFKENYLWQRYSIPVPSRPSTTEQWFVNNKLFFTNDYFKSLYLLGKLSEKLEDGELRQLFEREIKYLNSNKSRLIKENKYLPYPEAYILKLIENGLSKEYSSLVDEYVIPDYHTYSTTIDLGEESLPSTEGSLYSEEYLDLVRYSDYHRIFEEYELQELSKYSYNKMLEAYEKSNFVTYGLCSLVYSSGNLISSELLKEKLEHIFSNNENELIEENLYELIKCSLYFEKLGMRVSGLDNAVERALEVSKVDAGGNSFVVRRLPADREGSIGEGSFVINNCYESVDNLFYLLYVYGGLE